MTNTCDMGHETSGETRLLPFGGDNNAILCEYHYEEEIQERIAQAGERKEDLTGQYSYLPRWETLKIYARRIK